MFQVSAEFHFCAAHRLPNHPGLCKNLHGHNYKLVVRCEGPLDPHTGMVIDFFTLQKVVSEHVIALVDHTDLNTILDTPTAENICAFIWSALQGSLPRLSEIILYETHDCYVRYRPTTHAA